MLNTRIKRFIAIIFSICLFIVIPEYAQADSCYLLDSDAAVPVGFGAAYNTISPTEELLINVSCQDNSVDVQIGNGSLYQYIYKYGYIYRNDSWQQITFNSANTEYDPWLVGQADLSIPLSSSELENPNYVIAYICSWTGSRWFCGCRDASCAQPYWQLQKFQKAAGIPCTDNDGDGYGDPASDSCTHPELDCNDNDNYIYPGATEICGNSIDEDCNGSDKACPSSACRDLDNDGYDDCNPGDYGDDGQPGDCNDNEPYAYPGNPETCDSIDNNCDGLLDNNCDKDNDGYCDENMLMYRNNSMCLNTIFVGDGQTGDDCNDNNSQINPGAIDICENSIDENCDGIDEDCPCFEDWTCADWTACVGSAQTRICVDQNNCGTIVSKPAESRSCTDVCQDNDNDGYDNCDIGEAGDDGKTIDCDDTKWYMNPGAPETCDGNDNNCNKQTDENCDDDNDGYCDSDIRFYNYPISICPKTNLPNDSFGDDCDDNNNNINPNAIEVCDNDIDEDCDGSDLSCANVYHIATDGNDTTGDGSEANPWKTISKVNSMNFEPGDAILFKRGDVWREQLVISSSGTLNNKILFSTYGTGDKPIIDGQGLNTKGILAMDATYIILNEFLIRNTDETSIFLSTTGYDHTVERHIDIINCTIYNSNKNGISFWGTNVTIDNCDIHGINIDGIYGRGDYPIVTNSHIYDVSRVEAGDCIQLSTRAQDFYIANNILNNFNDFAKQSFVAHSDTGHGGIFENNICFASKTFEGHPDTYVLQVRQDGAIIRNNYIEGGKYGLAMNAGEAYYNIIKNSREAGIRIQDGNNDLNIYNNVIFNTTIGIFHDSDHKIQIMNNIITKCSNRGLSMTGDAVSATVNNYNCYYNNGVDIFGKTLGINSFITDPLFIDIDNYKLQPISPVINAGTDVGLTEDFEGNPVPQGFAPDIGAYEYIESGNDTISPQVTIFTVNQTTVNINNTITINYTVSDNTALKQVELWRTTDLNSSPNNSNWNLIEIKALSGTFAPGNFTNTISSAGIYWYGIHVVDEAGNVGYEPTPPGPIKVVVNQEIVCQDTDQDGYDDCKIGEENDDGKEIDCDDIDSSRYPNNTEICDGLDNDCNNSTTDGSGETAPLNDNQNGVCKYSVKSCDGVNGWINDYSSITNNEYPAEISCDGLDNNCDGQTDEGCACVNGTTQSCGSNIGECQTGTQICDFGSWGSCVDEITSIAEICDNSLDDDCDNSVDCDDVDCSGDPVCVSCTNECSFGSFGCMGLNSEWTCKEAGDGDDCLDKVIEACNISAGEICNVASGVCESAGCTDDCIIPSSECITADSFHECGNYDTDTCADWGATYYCGLEDICINGICQADQCQAQDKNSVIQCVNGYKGVNCDEYPIYNTTDSYCQIGNLCYSVGDHFIKVDDQAICYSCGGGTILNYIPVEGNAHNQSAGFNTTDITQCTDAGFRVVWPCPSYDSCLDCDDCASPTDCIDGLDNDGDGDVDCDDSDCSGDSACANACNDFDNDNYDNCGIGDIGDDGNQIDCDNNNSSIYPGASEICGNSIDEDCDGSDSFCVVLPAGDGLNFKYGDTITVRIELNNAANWITTYIQYPDEKNIKLFMLYDDGAHNDLLAGDNIWANTWDINAEDTGLYFIDFSVGYVFEGIFNYENERTFNFINPCQEEGACCDFESNVVNCPYDSFDWSHKEIPSAMPAGGDDWMTPVRNQGSCGSCWAFATVGSIEGTYNVEQNNPDLDIDLAEKYLVSSCFTDTVASDCSGGNPKKALDYIYKNGITLEDCFPYTSPYEVDCSNRCSEWNTQLWKIKAYGSPDSQAITADKIKVHITNNGPISAVMQMLQPGNGFVESIFRCDPDITPISISTLDHGVLITGYNDIDKYWVVKNSWGAGYDGNGYFKVGYNECGIEMYISYPVGVIFP